MSFGSEFATGFAQGFQMMSSKQDKKADREFRERTQSWRERTTKENQDIERQKHMLKTPEDLEEERKIRERTGATGAIPGRTGTSTGTPTGVSTTAPGAIEKIIREEAVQLGVDPDIAVRVAKSEGGLNDPVRQSLYRGPTGRGPQETSYGPFQLLIRPGRPGLGDAALKQGIDPRKPEHLRASIRFALTEAKKGGWGPWYGAAKAGIGRWAGLRGLPASTGGGKIAAGALPTTPTAAPAARPAEVAPGDTTDTQAGAGDLDAIIANPANEDQRQWAIREKARLYQTSTATPTAMFEPDPMANDEDDDEESVMAARGGAIPPRRKYAPGGSVDYFAQGASGAGYSPSTGTTTNSAWQPRKIGQTPFEYGPQPGAAPGFGAPPAAPKPKGPKGTPLMQGPGKGQFSWSGDSRFEEKSPTVQGWGNNSLKNLTDAQLQSFIQRGAVTANDPRGMFASGFGPQSWAFGVGTSMTPDQTKQMTDYARYRLGEFGVNNAYSQADQERAQSAIYQAQRQPQGDRSNYRAAGGPITHSMREGGAIPRRPRKAKYAAGGAAKKTKAVDKNTGLVAAEWDIEDYDAPTLQPNISKGGKAYGGPYSIPRQEDIGWGVDMVTPAQARSRERRAELAAFRAAQPDEPAPQIDMGALMMGLGGAGGAMGGQGMPGMMMGQTGMQGQPAPGAGSPVGYRRFAAGGPADPVYGTTTGVMPQQPGQTAAQGEWAPRHVGDTPTEYGPHAPPPPPFEPAKPKAAPKAGPAQWDLGAPVQLAGGAWSNDPSDVGGPGLAARPGNRYSIQELKDAGWSGYSAGHTLPAGKSTPYAEGGPIPRAPRRGDFGMIEDPNQEGAYYDPEDYPVRLLPQSGGEQRYPRAEDRDIAARQPKRSIRSSGMQPLGRRGVAEFAEGGGVGGALGGLGKKFDWKNYQPEPPEFYRLGPGGSEMQHGEIEQLNARSRRSAPGGSDTPTAAPAPAPGGTPTGDPGLRRPYDNPPGKRTSERLDPDRTVRDTPAPKAQKSKGRLKEEGEAVNLGATRDVETTGSIETPGGSSRGFELALESAGDEDFTMDNDLTRPMKIAGARGLKRGGAIPSRYEGGGQVNDEVSAANAARQRITQRQAARAGLTQGDLNRARSDPSRYGPYFGAGEDTAVPPRGTTPKKGPGRTPTQPTKPGPGPTPPLPPKRPEDTPTVPEPTKPPPHPITPTPPTAYPATSAGEPRAETVMGDYGGPYPEPQYAPYSGGMPSLPEPQEPGIAPQQLGPPAAPAAPTIPHTQPRVPSTGVPQPPAATNTLPRPGISSPPPGPAYPRPVDPQRTDRTPAPPPQRHVRQIDRRAQPAMGWVYVMGPNGQPTQVPKNAAHLYPPLPPPGSDDQLPARPATPHGGVLGGQPRRAPVLTPQPFPERQLRPPVPSVAEGGMIPHYAPGGYVGPFMQEEPPMEEPAIPARGAPPPFAQPAPAAQPVAGSPGAPAPQREQLAPAPRPKLPREEQDAIVNPNREPNPAATSVKAGLDYANDTLRQIIDGTSGSGVPTQGGEAQAQAVMQRIADGEPVAGIETMTPTEVKQVYAAVDPEDKLNDAQKHILAYQEIHDYYIAQGNPRQAAATSLALTLYSKQYTQKAGSMALAALDAGDVQSAMKSLDRAFDKIPDNKDLEYEIGPDGQIKYQITNRADGSVFRAGVMTPDMLKTVAYSLQTGVAFDQQMAEATREVAAWEGKTGVGGGKRTEGDIKREENKAINTAIARGIAGAREGNPRALMDAQQEIFERMGQTDAAVAAAVRMYEDAGVEPPPSLKAYGPKRTGEEGGGTMTERDRAKRAAEQKQFRTAITEAEKSGDQKALAQAHVAYVDAMYQAQKEDQSVDKQAVIEGMGDMDEKAPEYNTIQSGAYELLRKNPIHGAKAVAFMKAAITPGAEFRFTEDGRLQVKGLSQPLFISRDLLADIEAWRQANKKAP